MSTDLIATAADTDRAPDATAADGTPIYLDTSDGTALTDAALTAWRRAAVTGDLPTPARSRWQQLRAGVVNMWEFDAAEYWSADGRAQFVGRNEQGKSTMMAMTTLTMLTGDLSPRYVDTFGDSHRTFRYYLEATDDPKDRRSTESQLNRGWTWVEYGRMTDDGPQYFTTLLFVQARRSSPEVTKKWVTHTGPERVRDGLTLLRQQAVLTATDLPSLPGLTVHTSGRAYAQTVASTLFGFTDPERLRTVVELLKTLRTPKLGNRLNPDWVIERIREALPPLDSGEVAELAEGWDQLGQLAADRDAAREAQEAVTAFIKSTWNPWADATLRLAADDLVAAVTAVDDVTRDAKAAQARAEKTHTDRVNATESAEKVETERETAQQRRETLLRSQQYREAADAGRQVLDLSGKLKEAESAQQRALQTQQATQRRLATAEAGHATTAAVVTRAEQDSAAAAGRAAQDATAAGLPTESAQWSAEHDTARLEAALTTRRGHVRGARNLAGKLVGAQGAAERETRLLTDAQGREQQRRTAEVKADEAFSDASQDLSDQLERWTARVSAAAAANAGSWTAPAVAVRERWLESVFTECAQARPAQRLAQLIQQQWTQPAVDPLVAAAVTAAHEAKAATTQAAALEVEAARVESEPTPIPPVPHNWDRRVRPASSAAGAPLWELLDPVPDLPAGDLANLEAALAGAGLLDAWVTPDGAWQLGRDGDDHVVTLTASAPTGPTLSSVLTLAEPARAGGSLAALAATADRVLTGVGWRPVASSPTDATHDQLWVAADGAWATPSTAGRAAAPKTGARLLGASARSQERARRVAALRAEADQHRARATELTATEARHRGAAEQVRTLGGQAPSDSGVIGAARDLAAARRELADAEAQVAQRARAVQRAAAAVDEANAALLNYASGNNLDPARLDKVEEALNRADRSVRALATKTAELQHARTVHELRTEQLQQALTTAGKDDAEANRTQKDVDRFTVALQAARDALNADAKQLLAEGDRLGQLLVELEGKKKDLTEEIIRLSREQGEANGALSAVEAKRAEAEAERAARLTAWWVPVDAGLAAARGVQVPEGTARTLTAAVAQARSLRSERRAPRGWPDGAGVSGTREREQIVVRLRDRLSGPEFLKLNSTLNRTGGRSAVVEHDDATGLPRVQVLVDSSSVRFDPAGAVQELADKSARLGELHDEKMHTVMEELLSSTFVDHLRDKVKQTESLLRDVNAVLLKHPTGTTRTVLRLRRKQVGEHQGGYQVLNRLLEDSVDSPAVQQQVQAFLTAQIRAAQDEGNAEGRDWKELLVDKLDYRNWFAVVTEWRVLSSAKEGAALTWHELTRERHGQDSGGGKVMTMLQPLLATLATLYQNSETAPRPLWLDEAFDGVDAQNTTSLLGMLVDFDFDFILAGPKSLVASRHVPCAAVWMVNRAQAPMPGVDLGLWLYAAGTKEKVTLGAQTWNDPAAQAGADPSGSAQDGDQEVLWA